MSTTWPNEELRKIAETDDFHISPFREDGNGQHLRRNCHEALHML